MNDDISNVKELSECLMKLAKILSIDDVDNENVTADELLGCFEGNFISEERAGNVKRWLSTY